MKSRNLKTLGAVCAAGGFGWLLAGSAAPAAPTLAPHPRPQLAPVPYRTPASPIVRPPASILRSPAATTTAAPPPPVAGVKSPAANAVHPLATTAVKHPVIFHGTPLTLETTFQDQNPLLPLVMHTLQRNLVGVSGPKTEFDRAFDRMAARTPGLDRAMLSRIVLSYNNLPAATRNRGVASEFQHLDPRQPLNVGQVRDVFLQRRLVRPGGARPMIASPVARQAAVTGSHLPLGTLLRLASAAGFDAPNSAVKGVERRLTMTPDDLNHMRQSGGKITPAAGASRGGILVSPQQLQARADTIQQYLQIANNPRIDAIVKKGPKNGLILPGGVLYLRGANFGDQAAQNQIEIIGTLPGGFVGLKTPAFAPDIVAGKGSMQELQVTLPATLPSGAYTLKAAAGGIESNGVALSVDQAPPPPPQITSASPGKAGEMLALSGNYFKDTPGIPVVQFSRAGAVAADALPQLTGAQALTETAAFVQVPGDLPGGDYQITYIKGGSENLALDGVSNTVTVHIDGAPGPQLAPNSGGNYSVYPDDIVVLHGGSLNKLPTGRLRLIPLEGNNLTTPVLLTPQPGRTDATIAYQIPYNFKPGSYSAVIDDTEPVALDVMPYSYDAAFTEFDKTGPDGGKYFVVLTCLCDTQGYAVTTSDHFFNEVQTQWPLGGDGSMFTNQPVRDRVVIIAQPFWYDPGTTGSDFSSERHTVAAIATLAGDIAAIAGEPEIAAAIVVIAKLVDDIISLLPTTGPTAATIGKYDDAQTKEFSAVELQQYTHGGTPTFDPQLGRTVYAPPPSNDPSEDTTPRAWKVLFALNRRHQ